MTGLISKIQSDLRTALKQKDKIRVETLRLLLSEIHNKGIALRSFGSAQDKQAQGENLPDEEVVVIVQKEIKKRREAIEAYQRGKRDDLVKKEKAELVILSKYLPQQMSTEELKKIVGQIVTEVGASGAKDFGKVMRMVMSKVKGQAEGMAVAEMVRKQLSSA